MLGGETHKKRKGQTSSAPLIFRQFQILILYGEDW